MTAISASDITNTEVSPALGTKIIKTKIAATAGDSDSTFTVDLDAFGASNIDGIVGFKETTAGQVIVQEQPTTAVSSGTLTVTIGGSSVDSTARTYFIYAY